MIKKNIRLFLISFLCVSICFFTFTGCKKEEKDKDLAFSDVSSTLILTDTKSRVFFNNLEYNYASSDNYEELIEATSYIETLCNTLSTQLDEYKRVVESYSSELETSNTQVERGKNLIKIKNDIQEFCINFENGNLKIEFKDDKSHYLYESIEKDENSYICQVAHGDINSNYTIYQYIFSGSKGSLVIGSETKILPIYLTDLNENIYPAIAGSVFKV